MRISLLLAALLVGACSEKTRSTTSRADASVDAAPPLPENARVALTPDEDPSVRAGQAKVRDDLDKNESWIALGRAWVAKAESANDPTFLVRADACASVVLAEDPDHVAASELRGVVLRARHEYGDARKLAERITAKHPNEPSGWSALTEALLELGRYDEAKEATQKLVALGPEARRQSQIARVQWVTGDVTRAKETLAAAKSDDENASLLSGMLAWHEGDYDGALTSEPGRVAMAKHEWQRAAELFRNAHARRPSVEAAWLLGDAREAAGDANGAEEAYALAAKYAPTDPRTYSLFLSMRPGRSKEQYSEALRLASEVHVKQLDVYTEDALAWALYRVGMIAPAKTAMGRARRFHTPDARLLFHEGAIRIAGGDVAKGRDTIRRALAMNPAFDWRGAKEARELLGATTTR